MTLESLARHARETSAAQVAADAGDREFRDAMGSATDDADSDANTSETDDEEHIEHAITMPRGPKSLDDMQITLVAEAFADTDSLN